MTPVCIGSDHAGFALKTLIIEHLRATGRDVKNFGAHGPEPADYPQYSAPVCEAVLAGNGLGILVCGTGVGMSMAANRMPGVRAALCTYAFQARASREHNDANVLCLGGRVTGPAVALELVDIFLSTPFSGGRHLGRILQFDPAAGNHSPYIPH